MTRLPNTKIDINHHRIARANDLDELAPILFPTNKHQQRLFLAIFVELKWAKNQFLPSLEYIADKYQASPRGLETVRAKMRRLGLIDHVSRFNARHGYREGWIFSNKFTNTLNKLANMTTRLRQRHHTNQEQKDRNSLSYL